MVKQIHAENSDAFISLGIKYRRFYSYLLNNNPSLIGPICRYQLGGDEFFNIPQQAKVIFFPMSDNFKKFISTPSNRNIYLPNSFLLEEYHVDIQENEWLKTYRYEDFSHILKSDNSALFVYLLETDHHKPDFIVKTELFGKDFFLPLTLISFVAIAKRDCFGWDQRSKRWTELSLQLDNSSLNNDQRVIYLAQLCTSLVEHWVHAGRESLWYPTRISRFLAENNVNNAILQREIMLMIVEDCFHTKGWSKETIDIMKKEIQHCFIRINNYYEST